MFREVSTVLSRNPGSSLAPTTRVGPVPTHSPANHTGMVELFDPYSQESIVHTSAGGTVSGYSPAQHGYGVAEGTSKAMRMLHFALLSTVAVMVLAMLRLLQTT